MVSLGKIKQTKIQSASACQLAAYKCFYSEDWVLKMKRKKKKKKQTKTKKLQKQNPKIALGTAIRSVTPSMSSVVRLKTDCGVKGGAIPGAGELHRHLFHHCISQRAGSSQQVFHITHFTSSQAHSNPKPKISI